MLGDGSEDVRTRSRRISRRLRLAMTDFVESTSLKLYFHPFASFCQKALIAFYECLTTPMPR